jgi:hypothetical protein
MNIEKQPFRRYHEKKKDDTFTVKLNPEERADFEKLKYIIQQEKDSTAIKQLALEIAAKVLHEEKTKAVLGVALNNYRRNKRMGIVTFD